MLCLWSTKCTHACLCSILWKNPGWVPDCQRLEQIGLWSTSQLSLWSGVFTWRPELSFCCLLSKVISFIISMLYIEHCRLILPLFVAICDIWLSGLTYGGVYLILFLKPDATDSDKKNSVTKLSPMAIGHNLLHSPVPMSYPYTVTISFSSFYHESNNHHLLWVMTGYSRYR
jgi:hypothetical protein